MTNLLNTQRQPQDAFEDAIAEDRLSLLKDAPDWAGNFMYMGTKNGRDLFKHIDSREYLP